MQSAQSIGFCFVSARLAPALRIITDREIAKRNIAQQMVAKKQYMERPIINNLLRCI